MKKYQASTETEAILLAKEELGKDAIVMNIKTIEPKGIYKLFRKKIVEITAAIDEGNEKTTEIIPNKIKKEDELSYDKREASAIEQRLNDLQALLEKQMQLQRVENEQATKETYNKEFDEKNIEQYKQVEKQWNQENARKEYISKENINGSKIEKQENEYIYLIYKQLLNNEIDEKYAKQIINEIEDSLSQYATVDKVLAAIYQKIVLKLGQPRTIELVENRPKVVFFIGPTGVGKTTTIAKIASSLIMNKKAKVVLLTSDTYRIAAVEQLRIYANILSVPLKIVYTEEDIRQTQKEFSDYDVILIDTAGRSHKNTEQGNDIKKLLDAVDEDIREVYLVLSATTKNKDLENIVESYADITKFKLIFTKLDETINIGNILNVKLATNAPLSYATWGQNVPDDIGKIDIQNIAKQLLGGSELWTKQSN